MTMLNAVASIAILALTVTAVVVVLMRGGSRKQGLDQRYLDEEQAKAIREWKEARK